MSPPPSLQMWLPESRVKCKHFVLFNILGHSRWSTCSRAGLSSPAHRIQPRGPVHLKMPLPPTCISPVTVETTPLLTTLSPCFLSARTRITKPPQDQSVIKGTQASMVCGVAHDPRVTVRYSPCCGPREAKGRSGF